MPSSIKFNGVQTFRPGIYAEIDATSLGGSGVSTGNVAVVGDFPVFEQYAPTAFEGARALSNATLGDASMQLLGKIAFGPASDDRVGGGANKLILVNAGPSTQASRVFADVGGLESFSMSAKLWGSAGNRVRFSLAKNANDYDLTLSYDGISETYTALGSTPFSISTVADQGFFYEPSSAFVRLDKKAIDGVNAVEQEEDLVGWSALSPSKPVLSLRAAGVLQAANEVIDVSVVGTDASGVALTEIVAIPANADSFTCVNDFSTITKVVCQAQNAPGNAVDLHIYFDQMSVDPSTLSSAVSLAEMLNSVEGVTTAIQSPGAANVPADALDAQTLSTNGVVTSVTAHSHSIVSELQGSSALVSATKGAAGKVPEALTGALSGGSSSAANAAGFSTAMEGLLSQDVQIVVPMSDLQAVHSAALQHCKDAQVYGRERCSWVGAPALKTLDEVFADYTSKLNSRHVAVCAQSILYTMPDGTTQTLAPMYLALMLGCIQAGTAAGTPLTRKRPAVLDVKQHASWNPVLNANEAIQKGITALSIDRLGVLVERSVTSYMTDDNPIFSEVSANESINTSVRALRARLENQIGNPVLAGTKSKIQGSVAVSLTRQVKDGVIKAWKNVVIEDLGDRFDISYDVAAVEPLNFIKITATVIRIPG